MEREGEIERESYRESVRGPRESYRESVRGPLKINLERVMTLLREYFEG